MILKVFSSLNDSMILCFYDGRNEKLTIDSGVGKRMISKQHCKPLCIEVLNFSNNVNDKDLCFFDSVEFFRVKIMRSNVMFSKTSTEIPSS